MPYFHATHRKNLRSIQRYGLGGLPDAPKNFPCEDGTYLATSPEVAFGFLIENYINSGDSRSNPSAELDEFIVIVVDDSRLDHGLQSDPQVTNPNAGCFLYRGVIDIRGMPILDALTISPDRDALAGLSHADRAR